MTTGVFPDGRKRSSLSGIDETETAGSQSSMKTFTSTLPNDHLRL